MDEMPGSVSGRIGIIGPGQDGAIPREKTLMEFIIFGRQGMGRGHPERGGRIDRITARQIDPVLKFQRMQVLSVQ